MTVLRPDRRSKAPRGSRGRGLVLLAAWLVVSALAGPAWAEGVQVGAGPVSVDLPAPPSAAAGSLSTPPVEASLPTPVADVTVQVSEGSVALDQTAGTLPAEVSAPAVDARLSSPLVGQVTASTPALRAAVPLDSSVASRAAKAATSANAVTSAKQPEVAAPAPVSRSVSRPVSIPTRRAVAGSNHALPTKHRVVNQAVHVVRIAAPAPRSVWQASSQVAPTTTGVALPAYDNSTWDGLVRASAAAVGASGSAGGAGVGVATLAGLVLLLAVGACRLDPALLNPPKPASPFLALERPG